MERILHILPSLDISGGTQRFVMNYYRYIDKEKLQFDFLPYKKSPKNNFSEEIEKFGGNIIDIPEFKLKNIFKIRKTLYKIYKDKNYKIVHCHWASVAFLFLSSAKKSGIPHRILHSHMTSAGDTLIKKVKNIPFIFIGKKYANVNLACSEDAGKWLFKNTNFIMVYNAIETQKYVYNVDIRNKIRNELNIENKFVIGTIGRFEMQKNPFFAMNVFSEILKKNKNTVYLWVGSGKLEASIKKYVKSLKIENSVLFLNTRDDVNILYQAMDIFLLPSLFEGLPIVGVEAQASGLQCIFSDSITKQVNITDLIEYISLKKSTSFWAERILLHSSGYKRKDMWKDIKKSGFNISEETQKLEEIYQSLLR